MAAMVKLQLALSLVGIILALCHCSAAYTPSDNYLISCGTSVDTLFGRRVFVADESGSVTLTATQSTAVKASPDAASGFDAAALYKTARVFTAPSSYSFSISRPGRHFVRLRFFPFVCQSYDLAAARFKVSTQDAVLIDSSTAAKNSTSSPVCDEFLLDVARDTLIITFVPLARSVAFINAVEVVSVPDNLITDGARAETSGSAGQRLNPAGLPCCRCKRCAGSTWAAPRWLPTATRSGGSGPPISAS